MKRSFLWALILVLTSIGYAQAQSSITGKVTDAKSSQPVPFASVVVKGTTIGITADVNGNYSITAPANATTLVFSEVGHTDIEVAINNRTVINVAMEPGATSLDEVIVVGYGTMRREAISGSVGNVSAKKLENLPALSVDKMLGGKVAGVSIGAASGQPGAASQIRVRGTSSINAGNEPLYVIDGIPVESGNQSQFTNTGNALTSLNPNDIESISVLKDAAAASIYGSRAANGVILVTTKKGRQGKASFTARARYGVSWLANDNDTQPMTGAELLDFQRTALKNRDVDPDDPNSPYYKPLSLLDNGTTDWLDHFTRVGKIQEYEISAQAGSDKTSYYTSFNYQDQEGIFYGVNFKKLTGRLNVDQKLTNTLKVGTNININYNESSDIPTQSLYYANPVWAAFRILPWRPAYNKEGGHNLYLPENSYQNPRATAKYDEQYEKQYRVFANPYLEWAPIPELVFKTNNGIDLTFGEGRRYWDPKSNYYDDEATLQTTNTRYRTLTTSNTAQYSNTIFNEHHNLRVLLGQEASRYDYDRTYASSPDIMVEVPYPNTSVSGKDNADVANMTRTLLSFFGMVNYNFDQKYFLDLSLRADGSSLFAKENRWGWFWSVGGSWNIHKESFLEDAEFLDVLKLRASYGVNGNNDIPTYRQYGVHSVTQYNNVMGLRPLRLPNEELSWEKNASFNVGIDFGFWNKITGSIDVYRRKASDMLLSKPLSAAGSGFTSTLVNIGELENRGVEFLINANIFDNDNFAWSVGFNIAYNKSKVLDLGGDSEMGYIAPGGTAQSSFIKHRVGEKMFSYYLKDWAGVDPANGDALWYDANGEKTNKYSSARYVYKGTPEPKVIGGFNTDVSWKGFNLSIFMEYKLGSDILVMNEGRYLISDGQQMSTNLLKDQLNYWKKPGDNVPNPKPMAYRADNSYDFTSTRWLESGNYLRIKDVTLSYTLPKVVLEKIRLSNVRLYVTASNLYTFHNSFFFDAERGVTGVGAAIYPLQKTFIGGVEISF